MLGPRRARRDRRRALRSRRPGHPGRRAGQMRRPAPGRRRAPLESSCRRTLQRRQGDPKPLIARTVARRWLAAERAEQHPEAGLAASLTPSVRLMAAWYADHRRPAFGCPLPDCGPCGEQPDRAQRALVLLALVLLLLGLASTGLGFDVRRPITMGLAACWFRWGDAPHREKGHADATSEGRNGSHEQQPHFTVAGRAAVVQLSHGTLPPVKRVALVLALVLLAGCGGAGDGSPSTPPTTSSPASAPSY